MRKSVLRRPSPALIVSFVALVAALGGTSYAAFSLPNNSVGTKQLKNNAVTTSKLKNGAVTASKINPSGLTVPKANNANALGGVAASNYTQTSQDGIFASFKNGPVAFTTTAATIASLSVPAGSYAIFAKLYSQDTVDSPIVTCGLSAGGDFDRTLIHNTPDDQSMALQVVHTFTTAGNIVLTCSSSLATGNASANWIKITAIRQPSLSNTASP